MTLKEVGVQKLAVQINTKEEYKAILELAYKEKYLYFPILFKEGMLLYFDEPFRSNSIEWNDKHSKDASIPASEVLIFEPTYSPF